MSKRSIAPPVVSAKAYLADALMLIDRFHASRGSGGATASSGHHKKRPRAEEDGAALSSSSLIADAASSPAEALERGLEMLIALIEAQGAHLLPSCDAVARRLTALLPNRVDPTVHSPLLWKAVACLCTWLGASSAKVLSEVLELSLEMAASAKATSAQVPSAQSNHDQQVTDRATSTNTSSTTMTGLSASPIVAYFGDLPSLSVVAEAITAAGAFLPSQLLQTFAQRLAHDLYADTLQIQRKAVAVAVQTANDDTGLLDAFLLNATHMVLALLLVCRPIPAIVLTLAHSANALAPLVGRRTAPSSTNSGSCRLRHVLHQVRAVAQLIVMPEALPWYIPPADAVAQAPPPPLQVSAATAQPPVPQQVVMPTTVNEPTPTRQRSLGRSPKALGPMHPALAAAPSAAASSPRPTALPTATHAAAGLHTPSSLRAQPRSATSASPSTRASVSVKQASPATRFKATPQQQKQQQRIDPDDMPDIVLD